MVLESVFFLEYFCLSYGYHMSMIEIECFDQTIESDAEGVF